MTDAQKILHRATRFNDVQDMLFYAYRIHSYEKFDAVIIAPSWTPMRVGFNNDCIINCKERYEKLNTNSGDSKRRPMMKKNNQSYVLDWNGLHIAWINTGTCAGNVLDSLFMMADLDVKCLIFLGAAGGIGKNMHIGDMATPISCIDCLGSTRYLNERLASDGFGSDVIPADLSLIQTIIQEAKQQDIKLTGAKVFCTDTIFGEYIHYDHICQSGACVIEMETAAFFRVAKLMEKRAVAFLTISDNVAIGESMSAPPSDSFSRYNQVIHDNIPKLIQLTCEACK